MKIERLYVKHFKGIKEVEIFAGDVNEIAGPNGSGKSSVLDAIVAALAGKRSIDPKPLRDGESKGEITVDMGDIVVTRKFADGKAGTLTVKAGEKKLGQRDLDNLFDDFTFDPLYFSRQDPKKQVEILQGLAGPEFCTKLADIDGQIKDAMEERAIVNRELRKMGQLEKIDPVEQIDTSEVQARLSKAREHNSEQEKAGRARERAEERLALAAGRVANLLKELDAARAEKESLIQEVEALPQPQPQMDTANLEAELAEAGRRAEQVASYKQYRAKLADRTEKQQASNALDNTIETLRESRERLYRVMKLPIDGLTFGYDGIRVNGIPFQQLCTGEQWKISTEIGCATNSELKITRIKDGSLLDKESFQKIAATAASRGVQLWIESVTPHSDEAIELSEGEIKHEELFRCQTN